MLFGIKQQFARLTLQHFLENAWVGCMRITFFSCVGAQKTSTYNIHTYSHHL